MMDGNNKHLRTLFTCTVLICLYWCFDLCYCIAWVYLKHLNIETDKPEYEAFQRIIYYIATVLTVLQVIASIIEYKTANGKHILFPSTHAKRFKVMRRWLILFCGSALYPYFVVEILFRFEIYSLPDLFGIAWCLRLCAFPLWYKSLVSLYVEQYSNDTHDTRANIVRLWEIVIIESVGIVLLHFYQTIADDQIMLYHYLYMLFVSYIIYVLGCTSLFFRETLRQS